MSELQRWKSSEGGRNSVRHQSQRTRPSEDFGVVRQEFRLPGPQDIAYSEVCRIPRTWRRGRLTDKALSNSLLEFSQ